MSKIKNTNLSSVLEELISLHPKIIDLELTRIQNLLKKLDNPERKIAPVIHIAGTNGKGSVVAFIKSVALELGLRVHCYTSPHLDRFNERIVIDNQTIDEQELINILQECRKKNGNKPITFFEITTAAAFLAFSRTPADLVILETGLGGRLDATNVISGPMVSVITSISKDHTEYLGNTLDKIAYEKAGIIKKSVPLVLAKQSKKARDVIIKIAKEKGAVVYEQDQEWDISENDYIEFNDRQKSENIRILNNMNLKGAHQINNLGVAIAAIRCFYDCLAEKIKLQSQENKKPTKLNKSRNTSGSKQKKKIEILTKKLIPLNHFIIRNAVKNSFWPARWQDLPSKGPLKGLKQGWSVRLDGGHNGAAGQALAQLAAEWEKVDNRPLYIICGMITSKNPKDFLIPLSVYANETYGIEIPNIEASYSAKKITEKAKSAGHKVVVVKDFFSAIEKLKKKEAARLLICGSLYLAGEVLRQFRLIDNIDLIHSAGEEHANYRH